MSARKNILATIRARQGKAPSPTAAEREAVRAHIAMHPQSPRPRSSWDPMARFREQALILSSTVGEVASPAGVPLAVAHYLVELGIAASAVCWEELSGLNWDAAGMAIETREARDGDLVGITGAFCAIAETGTLMTVSGPRTPPSVSLLPETHIAVVSVSRIVRGMEDAWQLLRDELGSPPRAVNFISGPSRTADIEQTLTLGAHGPYRVHILVTRS
jgi:L-lactate dehydrogenase complex protein LldG